MDPEAPCLSPILGKYYVQNTRDMMSAFEKICAGASKSTILFDRHVISFLSAKDRQNIDPYLSELSLSDPKKKVLAQLKVLATIQKRGNLAGYPSIARWVLNNFEPVFAQFHDDEKRKSLQARTEKLVKEGDLKGFAALFDNPNLYDHDIGSFFQAAEHYQTIVDEQDFIKKELSKGNKYGQNTGRQIASVISMILSFLIMVFAVYKNFIGG